MGNRLIIYTARLIKIVGAHSYAHKFNYLNKFRLPRPQLGPADWPSLGAEHRASQGKRLSTRDAVGARQVWLYR